VKVVEELDRSEGPGYELMPESDEGLDKTERESGA
jgi:hypothetical protein